jgi:iron complex transport system substrate-binding protein
VLTLVALVFVGACGGTASDESPSATAPERIVSISPTATESLFAIGAGPQVVAVDDLSTYPATAPVTGLSAFQPSVETIAAYDPDLVVLSFDPGDVLAGLRALSIPAILQPTASSLDDAYRQIEDLGAATGRVGEAAELVAEMQADIAEVVTSAPIGEPAPTYYHEIDPGLYSATSASFVGEVYGLFGLENIADPADAEGYGYPQLSAEWIVEQDPDLIFLADTLCCGQDATAVAARPGWAGLAAVRADRVVELDDDIASRWGPRIVDMVAAIGEAVRSLDGEGS